MQEYMNSYDRGFELYTFHSSRQYLSFSMFTIIKAVIIILSATAVCLAEANPYYMIHTASLDLDEHGRPPVPTGMDDEQVGA